MPIVEISQEEVRICTQLAVERWLTKFGSVDKPNYAKGKADGKLEHELLANVRANICEWAVAKHHNVSWNVPWYPNDLHPRRKAIPDVGSNGEVRSIRTQGAFPIWEKDRSKMIIGARVLDNDYFSRVEVFPSFFADDYMDPTHWDEYIGGWRVTIEELLAGPNPASQP